MPNDNLNPQGSSLSGKSSLGELTAQAILQMGDYDHQEVDANTQNLFIMFANEVIDDVRMNPYFEQIKEKEMAKYKKDNPNATEADINEFSAQLDLPYYVSASDSREIDDVIVLTGLVYMYARHQNSEEKMEGYFNRYMNTIRTQMYRRYAGGNVKISLGVVDGGTGNG